MKFLTQVLVYTVHVSILFSVTKVCLLISQDYMSDQEVIFSICFAVDIAIQESIYLYAYHVADLYLV